MFRKLKTSAAVITFTAVSLTLTVPLGAFDGKMHAGQSGENVSDAAAFFQNWLGNTTNASSSSEGVVPSLAPGPWECSNSSDCSQGVDAGLSIGEGLSAVFSTGASKASFANRDDRNLDSPVDHPDFSR